MIKGGDSTLKVGGGGRGAEVYDIFLGLVFIRLKKWGISSNVVSVHNIEHFNKKGKFASYNCIKILPSHRCYNFYQ